MDYALHPRAGDIVAALVNGFESTMKIYSRKGDEITLTPIETKRHFPRMFHASRIAIMGGPVEIVQRNTENWRKLGTLTGFAGHITACAFRQVLENTDRARLRSPLKLRRNFVCAAAPVRQLWRESEWKN